MADKSQTRDRAQGVTPDDVLAFWIEETGPKGWYQADEALDTRIRDRFAATWDATRQDGVTGWTPLPRSALAAIILYDQFPRNMFRGDGRAYATDRIARAKSKHAVDLDWDLRVDGPARQFFYLPLMHSECLADQERCVRLFIERMPEAKDNLIHAKAHREVIRRLGRFPHRNGELGRTTTSAERAFLDEGGYGAVVTALRAAA